MFGRCGFAVDDLLHTNIIARLLVVPLRPVPARTGSRCGEQPVAVA